MGTDWAGWDRASAAQRFRGECGRDDWALVMAEQWPNTAAGFSNRKRE